MSVYSGHGGYAVFQFGATPTYLLLDNVSNEPNYDGKVTEYTDSAAGGWTQGLVGVGTVAVNLECNDDSTAAIDAAGVPIGTTGTLWLRRGALEAFDRIVGAVFGGVGRTNDNAEGGVPRSKLKFMHGVPTTWIAKAALPSGLKTYLQGLTPARLTP